MATVDLRARIRGVLSSMPAMMITVFGSEQLGMHPAYACRSLYLRWSGKCRRAAFHCFPAGSDPHPGTSSKTRPRPSSPERESRRAKKALVFRRAQRKMGDPSADWERVIQMRTADQAKTKSRSMCKVQGPEPEHARERDLIGVNGPGDSSALQERTKLRWFRFKPSCGVGPCAPLTPPCSVHSDWLDLHNCNVPSAGNLTDQEGQKRSTSATNLQGFAELWLWLGLRNSCSTEHCMHPWSAKLREPCKSVAMRVSQNSPKYHLTIHSQSEQCSGCQWAETR